MMKKLLLLAAAATMICAAASGQDQPKKKGGFWNKVKKGVESTTGLDVSKETLFVYPEMGKWKMEFISATGDSATGLVLVRIGIMPLAGQKAAFLQLTGVIDGDGQALPEGKSWKATSKFRTSDLDNCPLFHENLTAGTFSQYLFQPIRATVGMMMSFTSEETILPNAPPMITPTAMSMTLPLRANSRNSLKNAMWMQVKLMDDWNVAAKIVLFR